ncbi:MAG TPA: tetratricopeptide repeat protein [Micromonosporaceae bacterium]|nr:tetratricopeptide repeat protein [Micromonosporaceae bacterium]
MCVRPSCGGTYGPDGYCDECGRKAGTVPTAATSSAADSGRPASRTGSGRPGSHQGRVSRPGSAGVTYDRGLADRESSSRRSSTGWPDSRRGASGSALSAGGWSADQESGGRTGDFSGPTTFGGGRGRSSRGRLGAGLVEMPTMPAPDPMRAVIEDVKVAESKRFCGSCTRPVGRSRAGRPALAEGFCPHCRTPFSFLPDLPAGQLVHDRYEIIGCLAHGGQGWIYLARDRNVSDHISHRWVVLKGLIDTGDPDALAAAVAERRFLVHVDHPAIVKIHDFVSHPHRSTGTVRSYIVMEYVGGSSLREMVRRHRGPDGRRERLPLDQVIVYGLELLPALSYLHDHGLLYCDVKPDNIIHVENRIKIIDLGAVRQIGDARSAMYGTPGYQAPELETAGASVQSDIYTVGRMLAELSFDFQGFTTTFLHRLPDAAQVPLFAREESFYRLLCRATHVDPRHRFTSAVEMSEQLLGVLRQTLAADGEPRPMLSTLFTGERRAFGTEAGALGDTEPGAPVPFDGLGAAMALPLPQVDATDPGAAFLPTVRTDHSGDLDALVAALSTAPADSMEVAIQRVRARIEQGDLHGATGDLDALAKDQPLDWRIDWYRGLAALAGGEPEKAFALFNTIYDMLPGELAPQLALAVAAEWKGDQAAASRYYTRVWRTDHTYVSAAFGLARVLCARGDRSGAVAVLHEIPESSSHHVTAQVAAVRARVGAGAAALQEDDLVEAAGRAERVPLGVAGRGWLTIEVLQAALAWVRTGKAAARGSARVLGCELTERQLRFGLERAYRRLADVAHDRPTRVTLVDRANAVRPWTLV